MLTTVFEGSEGVNQSKEISQSDSGLRDTELKNSSIDTPSTSNGLFEDSPLLPGQNKPIAKFSSA